MSNRRHTIIWTNDDRFYWCIYASDGCCGLTTKENLLKFINNFYINYYANRWHWTHWGRVTHICVGNLTIIDFFVAWLAPSHYLNQCWNIVNWTNTNKLQLNFNQNYNIFIQENAFESFIWKTAAILSRPQCVNACNDRTIVPLTCFLLQYRCKMSKETNIKVIIKAKGSIVFAHAQVAWLAILACLANMWNVRWWFPCLRPRNVYNII